MAIIPSAIQYIHIYIHVWLIYIYGYIYHIFFIHLSVDGHLGCFHSLPIVNSAAINTEVAYIFLN